MAKIKLKHKYKLGDIVRVDGLSYEIMNRHKYYGKMLWYTVKRYDIDDGESFGLERKIAEGDIDE